MGIFYLVSLLSLSIFGQFNSYVFYNAGQSGGNSNGSGPVLPPPVNALVDITSTLPSGSVIRPITSPLPCPHNRKVKIIIVASFLRIFESFYLVTSVSRLK